MAEIVLSGLLHSELATLCSVGWEEPCSCDCLQVYSIQAEVAKVVVLGAEETVKLCL